MGSINVLIVDDHTILRQGLRALINSHDGIRVIGEAENGKVAIDFLDKEYADVIIMDIDMPILNGLDATRRIKKYYPKAKVIMLSMYDDDEYIRSSYANKADGFLVKHSASDEVMNAIEHVTRSKEFYCPTKSDIFLQELQNNDLMNDNELTFREVEILQLISEGNTSKQISENLFISERTVGKHRQNIMDKLNIHDIPSLMRYALEKGIIQAHTPKNL